MNNQQNFKIFKQDTSLIKQELIDTKKSNIKKSLILAKNKLIAKNELAYLRRSHELENSQLRFLINNEKLKKLNLTFYDENAAIFIQAHIRGWIARKNYEKVIHI